MSRGADVAFLVVLMAAGLLPGVDLAIHFGALVDALGSLWRSLPAPSLGGAPVSAIEREDDRVLVSCVRCAVAAAHPRAELPHVCPACGRHRRVA
jgi:hypothetical protein